MSVLPRTSQIAVAGLLLAVAFGLCGVLVWNMTTTEYFGPPGHFTRSVQYQVSPRRADALWIIGVMFAAFSLFAAASRRG